jgi:hypothetical protein
VELSQRHTVVLAAALDIGFGLLLVPSAWLIEGERHELDTVCHGGDSLTPEDVVVIVSESRER